MQNIYSRRKRIRTQSSPDPLTYDLIDQATRVRIVHVAKAYFQAFFRSFPSRDPDKYWEMVRDVMQKELGVFSLVEFASSTEEEVLNYFLAETDIDRCVDWLEVTCKAILLAGQSTSRQGELARSAVREINEWLREASIGFEFVVGSNIANSEFVEISDRVSHSEVVVPALHLLTDTRLKPANQEFLSALAHLRHKEYGDAISEATKALESAIKIIAAEKGWPHDPDKDTLRKLLEVALKNSPVDPMWQAHFDAVRSVLESGLGTARNRLDSHGQGAKTREVPDFLAKFAIHQAASAILFFCAANGFGP